MLYLKCRVEEDASRAQRAGELEVNCFFFFFFFIATKLFCTV